MNKKLALLSSPWSEFRRIAFGIKHSAMVDVTDNCNLRCIHCYHFNGKDEFKTEESTLEEWEIRFNRLYQEGVRFILLVGGEPALRIDVLMLANRIFPFIYVITNGMISIPEEFNHRLFVSLDGSKKTNDGIRGEGVYDKVLENFSGDKRAIINMTLTNTNYLELEQVVQIAIQNRFRGVVCNVYAPTTGNNPILLTTKERNLIISELRRVKHSYPRELLLSRSMINWYAKGDHRDHCYWGDQAIHYDVAWNKRRCFANTDCSSCGCLGGAFQSPRKMLQYPLEMLKLM